MSSLKQKTLKGIGWAGMSRALRVSLGFVVTMILAHLLTPADFGIIGMCNVFIGLALIFEEMGLGAAIIQKKDLTEAHINSVFYVNVASGAVLAVLIFFASPLIAAYYKQGLVAPVLRVMSVVFLIASLAVVQKNLLMKKMDFKKLAAVEVAAVFVGGVVGITCALSGLGVWSLVAQLLSGNAVTTLLLWALSDWRPRRIFSKDRFMELFGFSANLTGANLLDNVSYYLPQLILGRFLGVNAVGYFTIAAYLMEIPRVHLTVVFAKVMFPAFSIVQDNLAKVRENYLKYIQYIAVVTFPIYAGYIVVAPEAILTIYGSQWVPVILLIQILSVMGLRTSVTTTVGTIFRSQGRTDIHLRWGLINIALRTLFIFAGIPFGIEGVAVSLALFSVTFLLIPQVWANRLIGLSTVDFFRVQAPILGTAALMGAIAYAFRLGLLNLLAPPMIVTLLATAAVGGAAYPALAKALGLRPAMQMWDMAMELLRSRKSTAAG